LQYRLIQEGLSIELLDSQDRIRRASEQTMLFAMVGYTLVDGWLYGPSGSIYNLNSRFDSTEALGYTVTNGKVPLPGGMTAGWVITPSNHGGLGKISGSLDDLTQSEKLMIGDLIKQGKNVDIIPRSNVSGEKTPDFIVDGVRTELKTLSGTSLNTPVTRITDGFKQGANTVIIDARATGMTAEQATTVLERVDGIYNNSIPGRIEIWTNFGIIYGGE